MSVTGIRALLEAAEFLKKEENAKKRASEEAYQNTRNEKQDESNYRLISASKSDKFAKNSSLSHSSSTSSIERRADLKARFECIQHLLPATKGKKCSNLAILRNATRHIQTQARLSREFVTEIQHFSQEKSQKDKKLERAWQRLSVLGVDLARVRRKVRSRHAQREKREESSLRGLDVAEEAERDDRDRLSQREGAGEAPRCGPLSPSRLTHHLSDGMSSLSEDDDDASESTTTASECGSNIAERGEITDEASECGEIVVQEGTVPSQSHTCVTLSPTPLSPASSQDSRPINNSAPSSGFQTPFPNSCNASINFANGFSALTGQSSEPLSGTSSDSGISSGINDDASGEVKLPMKKRKLARSLVQDIAPTTAGTDPSGAADDQTETVCESVSSAQPAEKKRILSPQLRSSCLLKTAANKPHHEVGDKQISLITTLPSYDSVPSLAFSSAAVTPSLSASMPLLQRTLTDPRPTTLVRHASFESPESLDPNWMNQRIVPVYQLLSGTNASPPSVSSSFSSSYSSTPTSSSTVSAPATVSMPNLQSSLKPFGASSLTVGPSVAYQALPSGPAPERVSLVTHSPLNMFKAAQAASAIATPTMSAHSSSITATVSAGVPKTVVATSAAGPAQLLLPVLGGRNQPIVLMPLTASSNASPSLVPIQLVSDSVLSAAAIVNGNMEQV